MNGWITWRKGKKKAKFPKLIASNCISIIDDLLNAKPAESFFVSPVKGDVEKEKTVTALVETQIFPAYQSLRKYLAEEYLPKAPDAVGISDITDGKKYYEQRVHNFTTFDISPKEVFDIGQSEVKRIRAEMQAIIDDFWK